ncbi:MAG: 30S ribosomal protein S9 [Candidatus Lokiarchaeota archaeon]
MEQVFRDYDDSLLSGDERRTEPKHFGGKKARARRQKSFR